MIIYKYIVNKWRVNEQNQFLRCRQKNTFLIWIYTDVDIFMVLNKILKILTKNKYFLFIILIRVLMIYY